MYWLKLGRGTIHLVIFVQRSSHSHNGQHQPAPCTLATSAPTFWKFRCSPHAGALPGHDSHMLRLCGWTPFWLPMLRACVGNEGGRPSKEPPCNKHSYSDFRHCANIPQENRLIMLHNTLCILFLSVVSLCFCGKTYNPQIILQQLQCDVWIIRLL